MKVGLIGLPQCGKTTVFNALSGFQASTGVGQRSNEPNRAIVKVMDPRIEELSAIYNPKKKVYANIEYMDFPGIQEKTSPNFWANVRNIDVLVQIVRAFEDSGVAHPKKSIDFCRDIRDLYSELIIADLTLVENNLEKIEKGLRASKKKDLLERKEVLLKCKEILEAEQLLGGVEFNEVELETISPFQFLTRKPMIIVVNFGEGQSAEECQNKATEVVKEYNDVSVMTICGKLEMEVAQLSADEQEMFLEELGITELALHRFVQKSFDLLGMICFFTVGEDEVRAWEIRKGTKAVEAAGTIHSDLQRGFIRAETFHYDDLIELDKNPGKLKEAGKMRLEGKEYLVKDGDILCIRFNVSSSGKKK